MRQDDHTSAMLGRLLEFHAQNAEERLGGALLRRMEDPLKPKTGEGRFRINPILVLLAAIGALAAGTFLYFSVAHS